MHDADAAADLELLLRRGRRIDGSLEAYLRRRKLPMIQASTRRPSRT